MAIAGERADCVDMWTTWLFAPRPPQDWFSPRKLISFYNTSALKRTLERLVDFDRINAVKDETRQYIHARVCLPSPDSCGVPRT
jgi:hypothetical protein